MRDAEISRRRPRQVAADRLVAVPFQCGQLGPLVARATVAFGVAKPFGGKRPRFPYLPILFGTTDDTLYYNVSTPPRNVRREGAGQASLDGSGLRIAVSLLDSRTGFGPAPGGIPKLRQLIRMFRRVRGRASRMIHCTTMYQASPTAVHTPVAFRSPPLCDLCVSVVKLSVLSKGATPYSLQDASSFRVANSARWWREPWSPSAPQSPSGVNVPSLPRILFSGPARDLP